MAVLELYNELRAVTLALDWPLYVVREWKPARITGETGSETLEIEVHGLDEADCYDRASTLELWLQDAQEATREGRASPVWLRHTPNGARGTRSARITAGTLDLADYVGYTSHGRMLDALLIVVREQARGTECTLPLSNAHGTDIQTGLTVSNAAESARSNWVAVVGEDVEGDLPAPFCLVFQNTFDHKRRLAQVYYGVRHISTGPLHGAFLCDASGVVKGMPAYGDTSANLETVLRGTESLVGEWQFASTATRTWEGAWFAFAVGRFARGSTYWLEARIIETTLDETTPLSPPVSAVAPDRVIPLGRIELPPWPKMRSQAVPYLFDLQLRSNALYETTLDYVLFLPSDAGLRHVAYQQYNAVYQQLTVDDGINDEVAAHYSARAGTVVQGRGQSLRLVPGRNQRLYFLQIGDQGDAWAERTMSVRVEYAPRFALL